ncbi:unnamed protein product [Amoebophrya sp. A120]|nr:unnamed protein product [Amoebophrya sp. A120]|eukprot:GSA120T00017515001.1
MTKMSRSRGAVTYWVEHMEEGAEISDWVALEYAHMRLCVGGDRLVISQFPEETSVVHSPERTDASSTRVPECAEHEALKAFLAPEQQPPAPATDEIIITSGSSSSSLAFDAPPATSARPSLHLATSLPVLLQTSRECFTGKRICLLDMKADQPLRPDDAFDFVVAGGILGNILPAGEGSADDGDATRGSGVPVDTSSTSLGVATGYYPYTSDDRTAEIRAKLPPWVERRHLGSWQMTTDTALLVSKLVLEERLSLEEIPFLDGPEIPLDEAGPEKEYSLASRSWNCEVVAPGAQDELEGRPSTSYYFDQVLMPGVLDAIRVLQEKKSGRRVDPKNRAQGHEDQPDRIPGTPSTVCGEVVEMEGFRYVARTAGEKQCQRKLVPIVPPGMREYWQSSCDDDIF